MRLCLFRRERTVATDKTRHRPAEVAAFAATVPIVEVVIELGARRVRRDAQDESAVGTGDCFDGHRGVREGRARTIRYRETRTIPTLGEPCLVGAGDGFAPEATERSSRVRRRRAYCGPRTVPMRWSCGRPKLELAHDGRAMRVHCLVTDIEQRGDLFAGTAFSDQLNDLALPSAESEPLAQGRPVNDRINASDTRPVKKGVWLASAVRPRLDRDLRPT